MRDGLIEQNRGRPENEAQLVVIEGLQDETLAWLATRSLRSRRTVEEQIRYELEARRGFCLPDSWEMELAVYASWWPPPRPIPEEAPQWESSQDPVPSRDPLTVKKMVEKDIRLHVRYLRNRRPVEHLIRRYFPPIFNRDIHKLSRLDIVEWRDKIGDHSHAQANGCLAQLKAMFNRAMDLDLFHGVNPALRIKPFRADSRTRFVQPDELPALLKAIRVEHDLVQAYFLLMLTVGTRRDETRVAKWVDMDLSNGLWHIPDPKNREPHTLPLPDVIAERLRRLPRCSAWVFAGKTGKVWSRSHVNNLWNRIRRRAGSRCEDIRIHDLRRTLGSYLAIEGCNTALIGKVLNHRSPLSTAIYTRLNRRPEREALNRNANQMFGKMRGKPQDDCSSGKEG